MVETHPERRDRGDDFSLSGKRGHRNPRRHSGREAGIPGRESYRGSHAAVSLVIPAGKPESRVGKATGEAMPPFPSSFRPGSRNPGQGKLQGKPCRRFPRHSGREAEIQCHGRQRHSHPRHQSRIGDCGRRWGKVNGKEAGGRRCQASDDGL